MNNSLNEEFKIIRREGKIVEGYDWENDKGFNSLFYVEWRGDCYRAHMINGEVVSLRKLWEV